jgi:hypothetical protein
MIEQVVAAVGYRSQSSVYTPIVTVLTFLKQLLSSDGSCQEAVTGLIAHRVVAGQPPCSPDTGGYVKARSRLPESIPQSLMQKSGQLVEQEAPDSWLWNERRVRVVDGSTVRIADTEANRAEYPLQKNLKPGLHYPVVRILVIFSLAVGTVLDAALRPYQGKGTGETGMLRDLAPLFEPSDVLLGDRYFSGYWDVAWWLDRGVDIVSRKSVSRMTDFRRGKRLGRDDHLIVWRKTARPDWVDDATAARIPPKLVLREVRIVVAVPGFRTRVLIIITTLLDPIAFPKEALAELYRRRWQAELNLRSLKTHMGMEQLRCKSPSMVRKEFATYLLAYNCVRRVSAVAACRDGQLLPWEISFKGSLQAINEFFPRLGQAPSIMQWIETLLATAAAIIVGNRPDRIEPYTCKTRPKDFPPPKEHRHKYKTKRGKRR